MSGRNKFVDTNVLLYAHDVTSGVKRARAAALIQELWAAREGCVSIQVLQEFFVNATRKLPVPLTPADAKDVVLDLAHWNVHVPAADDVLGAIGLHQRVQISFWDAMIVRSASEMACGVVYSEDLGDGQNYEGVRVQNPFRPAGQS